jgi:hypothetical protein
MADVRNKDHRSTLEGLPAIAGAHASVKPGKVTQGSWDERRMNDGL